MNQDNTNAVRSMPTVHAVIGRALLGLAVYAMLILMFCALAWGVLCPSLAELHRVFEAVPSGYVMLAVLCAVLLYMATHIPSAGAVLSDGLWDALVHARRTRQHRGGQ
ncbi:hypothetical protein VSR68_40760 [Paraburkholderia phymatum]|uniref:hypothetical protein n=1 Tax=Paraburkholderia phymatum TaxID=148447 RepID=UPI00316EBEF6